MAEGFSASEAAKEAAEHAKHTGHRQETRHDRLITIAEALLLAIVTITAAWSGYSAAKWSTEGSLHLAKASAERTKANRAYGLEANARIDDGLTFNAWLGAYSFGNAAAMRVARRRFSPEFEKAFVAWLATKPFTNPHAPKGPRFMPQYHPAGSAVGPALDVKADAEYEAGRHAAETGDDYVRITVILASILFLVGISSHFTMRSARIGLTVVAASLLVFAAEQILTLPGPP